MFYLGVILLFVVVSIGLLLCAAALRSMSLALFNLAIWLVATIVALPWNNLALEPPIDPEEHLGWDCAVIWAVFLLIAVAGVIYCAIARKLKERLPKREFHKTPKKHHRRRRRRSHRGESSEGYESDDNSERYGTSAQPEASEKPVIPELPKLPKTPEAPEKDSEPPNYDI